jgi:hypothetical protein
LIFVAGPRPHHRIAGDHHERNRLPHLYLDPIEKVLAKLKALLRRAAARTVDTLWNAISDSSPNSPQPNAQTISSTQDIDGELKCALVCKGFCILLP